MECEIIKKKYPSQIRYETQHPAITFRVSIRDKEKILQLSQRSGKSVSELVRVALLGLEKDFSKVYETTQQKSKNTKDGISPEQSFYIGLNLGTSKWKILIPCWKCQNSIEIKPNSKEHKKIIKRMDGDLSHDDCSKGSYTT
jgi:hypothetical protein